MILVVWLYVGGLAFLMGGLINAEIERAAIGDTAEENGLPPFSPKTAKS
jgi:uncharacterized BrkB/YihY/UPF0761 family membrane protein